jgi:hypothetical protein
MSAHPTLETSHDLDVAVGDRAMPLSKAGPLAMLIGLLGVVGAGVMVASPGTREAMLGSYLFGWYFWMTIVLGMLGLACLHHTVRGSWCLPWLKLIEAGSSPTAFGIMFILFLPILIMPGTVYEWVNPGTDHLLLKKVWYLNQNFWTGRTVFYFALWAAMSWFMKNSVKRQEDGAPNGMRLEMGRSSWGAVFIVLYVLSITFATTDWGMSLQPHWYSTMYGVQQMIAGALGASGLIVAILCINAKKSPYTSVVTPNLTKDWGNILFMFTMLWAYTTVSQLLIIWNGNLPETASYFARRGRMGWNAVGLSMILGVWLIPWMTLLSPRIKRYPHLLRGIAGWIFVVHVFDVYYTVVPALPSGGFHEGHGRLALSGNILYDLIGLAAVGGIWFAVFANGVRATKNLLPTYDNRLQEALQHAH